MVCVTKLSGVGDDAVFLGMMRPIPFSKRDIRCWIAPNGIILACGPMFSALTGMIGALRRKVALSVCQKDGMSDVIYLSVIHHVMRSCDPAADEMVGLNVKTMVADQDALQKMLQRCMDASTEDFENQKFTIDVVNMANKYTGNIPCHLEVTMGGTNSNRMFVLHIHRIEEVDDNLLVLNDSGNVTFATIDLAITLGYPLKTFLKMSLSQLMPPPVCSMHAKWLVDAPPSHPPTSCRAGTVVNMLSATNQLVPVRLKLSQREEQSGLKHICRIYKATQDDFFDDRRIVIIATYDGMIESVEIAKGSNSTPAIFGFPSQQLKVRSFGWGLQTSEERREWIKLLNSSSPHLAWLIPSALRTGPQRERCDRRV